MSVPRFKDQQSKDKFYKMRWSGEVYLTDQILIKRNDGTYTTNVKGRFLQLMATGNYGLMPGNRYNAFPVIYKRYRKPTVA